MNNLKLYSEIISSLKLQSDEEVLLFYAFDVERNRLFFASSANIIYATYLSVFQNDKVRSKCSLPAEVGPIDLEPGDFITAFEYLMEKEALVVGTSGGIMLLVTVNGNETEVLGRVEGGVKCISPSPDGDLLGVTTGFGQLLVMTHDWDLLYEIALEDLPEGADVREQELSPGLISGCPISWRGDGKYFATLAEASDSTFQHKRVKVWERDTGILHALSEAKVFMGAILDWMPSGSKIATVYDRKVENKGPLVVFFERNGLERSSFPINAPSDVTVELLKWNCSSDLLAAVVRSEQYDYLKIWFFCNNHWYLKHEVRYPRKDGMRFMWDPIKPLQLICWTLGGQVMIYNFIWMTAVMENSIALVIDDSKVLATPLSLSLLPPPMFSFCLNFTGAVRDIALYSKNAKNFLAAVSSDGNLSIVELPVLDIWDELDGKEFFVEPSVSDTAIGSFLHLAWLDTHVLVAFSVSHCTCSAFTTSSEGALGFFLQEIELECSENLIPSSVTCSGWHTKLAFQNSIEGLVIGISTNPAKIHSAFVQFDDGKIFEYTSNFGTNKSVLEHNGLRFSSPCPWMDAVLISSGQTLLFGLDDVGRLQLGEKTLCNNCGSFAFYSNSANHLTTHLVLATKQNLLFVVDMRDILHGDLELAYDSYNGAIRKERENIDFVNIWERGAKIIGVLHGDEAAVLLLTTRGNIECIYPRKLVISSIMNALATRRFKDALFMVRRHRIDFNIIVDYCGLQAFIQSAAEFVKQVNNLSYITEFVCAITNENVAETLYKKFLALPGYKESMDVQGKGFRGTNFESKVSSVLLAIRRALEEHIQESPQRELCILTTLARSDPPAIEEALGRIKLIREMELLGSNDPKRAVCPAAEEALKHLLWLSDNEAVYEAALGLYDLNLAAIVALNSQRDPKEFLPFLQELECTSAVLMRYKIDLKLQRFENALKHIVSAGDAYFPDSMSLMKENPQLFPLGLKLITDPPKRAQVLEAWGDHLTKEKCFEDAAMAYLSCTRLDKALKVYRECGKWSGVLTVAGLLKLGKDVVELLAHELCEELQALGKPAEAAKVALEYCRDVDGGISLLIAARDWEEALRVSFMHSREDLISEVKKASLECASNLIDEYKESLEKVGKYLARYLAVRQRRLLLAAKLQSEERSINDLDDDATSEASNAFSGMSVYTTGSRRSSTVSTSSTMATKTRDGRRQRSRGKIRPGSPGEELALVEHLKVMSLATGPRQELKSLLTTLAMLGEEETGRKLQHAGENFQLSQMAAVKLTERTMSDDSIDEHGHTLENYVARMKAELPNSEDFSWRSRVFLFP